MFKKFVLPAVALAAITSCSSDEVLNTNSNPDGQDYISFNTVVGNNSRVSEITGDELNTVGKQFYVVAYGDESFYFDRQLATYKAAAGEGESQTLAGFYLDNNYYWPSYKLTFAAWYPTTGFTVTKPTYVAQGDRHQIVDYSIPLIQANEQDIIIAREQLEKPVSGTAAQLNFRHIFSQIEVCAKYAGRYGEGSNADKPLVKVEVGGVSLRYMRNTGTFTFPSHVTAAGNNANSLATTDWVMKDINKSSMTEGGTGDNIVARFDRTIATTTLGNEFVSLNGTVKSNGKITTNNNFLVIPQDFENFAWDETKDANGSYLSVKVRISMLQADGTYKQYYPAVAEGEEEGDFGWAAVGLFSSLESLIPGQRYVVNLSFSDESAGKGDPDPDPEDPEKPGEDILGKPIYFTVTVTDWVNASETNIPGEATNTPGA